MRNILNLVISIVLLAPAVVLAEGGGLHHAEHFEMRRDGAWIVNFLLLFSALFWIAKRFIAPALRKRSEDIAKLIEDAEKARNEALEAFKELDQKAKKLSAEADKMKKDAVAEAELLKEEAIAKATDVSKRILEKAKHEIESETDKAKNRLRRETVELAVKIAEDLLAGEVKAKDQKAMVDQYLQKVEAQK